MRFLQTLTLVVVLPITFAAEAQGVAGQIYDLMNYDNFATQMYEQSPFAKATGKDNDELIAGFREHLIKSMGASFSNAELTDVARLLTNGQEVPEQFSNWVINELPKTLLWFKPNTNDSATIMYNPPNKDQQ